MARAPSKKKSPQEKRKPANKIARNETQLAWVWSQYKAKIDHDKSVILDEKNTLNQNQIKRARTSHQKQLSKEELIARNIRAMSTKSDQNISDRRGFNKVEKFIFAGIAVLSLAAIVNYESKIGNSHSSQQSVVNTRSIGSADKGAASHTVGSFDPRAVELLSIASANITMANSLQHRTELDEALFHLRKLSNNEIQKAINLLKNVRDPTISTSIEPVIHALEKIVAE
jgi:hypothetical protein